MNKSLTNAIRGMTDVDGGPVGRLEGPLRWAVDLGPNALVEIAGALSPPA